MNCVRVALRENSYSIVIGEKILPKAGMFLRKLSIGQDAVIITNRHIKKLHGTSLALSLRRCDFSVKFFEVPDSEQSKSAGLAFSLIQKIAAYDVQRKIFIIAFGGGVIGDLAGFVAAVYRRGIPYVQIPTTLLAQIDSSIGGKTAIDLSAGKNLVGAFYQPKLVLSDISVLSTLKPRQIRNGLAEAVKYGVIQDKNLFSYIERNYQKLLSCNQTALQKVVVNCSRIKANITSFDEKEKKGVRTILNFGHTVGHAIEAAGCYDSYHHGEAIALGMRVASGISCRMGLLSPKDSARLDGLLSRIGLPARIQKISLSDILNKMSHDKKFRGKKNRFVLALSIGRVIVREEISFSVIKAAVEELM